MKRLRTPKVFSLLAATVVALALLAIGIVVAQSVITRDQPALVSVIGQLSIHETLVLYPDLNGQPDLANPLGPNAVLDFGDVELDAFGNVAGGSRIPLYVLNNAGSDVTLTVEASGDSPQLMIEVLFGPRGGEISPAPGNATNIGVGQIFTADLGVTFLEAPGTGDYSFVVSFMAEASTADSSTNTLELRGAVFAEESLLTADTIANIRFKLTNPAGAGSVGLSPNTTLVVYSDSNNLKNAFYTGYFATTADRPTTGDSVGWGHRWILGEGDNLDPGEVVEVIINLQGLPLGANTPFKIELIPRQGAVITVERTTPLEIMPIMELEEASTADLSTNTPELSGAVFAEESLLTADTIANIRFKLTNPAGAGSVGLSPNTTLVVYSDSNNLKNAFYTGYFATTADRPATGDSVGWGHRWILGEGDNLELGEVVEVIINLQGLPLGANTPFKIEFIPGQGAVITVERTTPLEIVPIMDLG